MTSFNPELDLELNRLLKAPPAKVWCCWTEPALLMQWFAPKPVITTEAIMDVRAGGRFFTKMVMPDGTEYPNDGSFLQVIPELRLVFTDIFTADWCPVAAPGLGFSAILDFAPEGGGTRYTARARHRTPDQMKQHADMGFHDGWGAATTQLELLAASL
ncbi:MAG: SRPBCC family protein [Paracoccaceae bacterium]|nr:SRPBCC family protein [Paracoccaceae bacterium]